MINVEKFNSMSENSNTSVIFFELEDSNETDLMSPNGYVASAVTLFLIGFFGFFLNLGVIVLMIREKRLWTPLNVILFNLVCSDLSVSILGNPFTLLSAVFHRWIWGRTMCVIYGFFMSLLGITSITTLTVLSFERYIMISKPFHSHHLTIKGAKWIVLGIWTYSASLTIPPLIGWGKYVNEAANISCSVNWEHKDFNSTTYIIFLFALGLVIPVAIISFSYVNIILTMKQKTIRMGRVTKAESRVAIMVGVMIIAFLLAWSPYAVLALIIAFGDSTLVTPSLAVVPALVAKSSICYNPVIYVGLNTQFQTAWRKLLGIKTVTEDNGAELTTMSQASRYLTHNTYQSEDLSSQTSKLGDNKKLTTKITCDKNSKFKITLIKMGPLGKNNKTAFISRKLSKTVEEEEKSDVGNEYFDRNLAEEIEIRFIEPEKSDKKDVD